METTNNRNNKGRFVKGHTGAKPKGAISKQNRKYFDRIERILKLLETNLEDNINSMGKKEQVMLWFELQKFINTKFTRFTDPEPEKDPITSITFHVVGADGKSIDDPPVPPPAPSGKYSALPKPVQVSPPPATSIRYGEIDIGKVRSPNRLSRIRRF